jgi:predicted Zn finger-like uncharacterized protein
MPENVRCPECERNLRVPDDLLGKLVRCPSCKATFTAHAGGEREPEIYAEDEPRPSHKSRDAEEEHAEDAPSKSQGQARVAGDGEREVRRRRRDENEADDSEPGYEDEDDRDEGDFDEPRRRRKKRKGSRTEWRKVRSGITLVMIGVFAQVVTILFVAIALIALAGSIAEGPRARGEGPPTGGLLVICFAGIIGLTSLVLNVIGNAFCAYVPPFNGARTLAITSLVLVCANILLACIAGIVQGVAGAGGAKPAGAGGNPISFIGNLVGLAQIVVFVFFMRQLSLTLGERGLARSIVFLLVYSVVAVLVSISLLVWLALTTLGFLIGGENAGARAAGVGGSALAVLGIVGFLMFGVFIWYIISLFQLRGAITRYVGD